MPRLEDFREMIDGVEDPKVLESGQALLREMIQINELRLKLEALESGLTDGGKAIFYFFAEELDEDEIVFATERISGRLRRLQRAEENKGKESKIEESDDAETIDT